MTNAKPRKIFATMQAINNAQRSPTYQGTGICAVIIACICDIALHKASHPWADPALGATAPPAVIWVIKAGIVTVRLVTMYSCRNAVLMRLADDDASHYAADGFAHGDLAVHRVNAPYDDRELNAAERDRSHDLDDLAERRAGHLLDLADVGIPQDLENCRAAYYAYAASDWRSVWYLRDLRHSRHSNQRHQQREDGEAHAMPARKAKGNEEHDCRPPTSTSAPYAQNSYRM